MSEKRFTKADWKKINKELKQNGSAYGLPNNTEENLIIGSFNIRKLGSADSRNKEEWEFLAEVCCHFDLLAIQEVMDDLAGLKKLKALMLEKNPDYRFLISDATGAFPGESGLTERLCFVYDLKYVQREEVASDVTYDRSKLIATLFERMDDINDAFLGFTKKMQSYQSGLTKTKPTIQMPVFLSFIRQPYCVAFRLGKPGSSDPYEIMAINAHLLFGQYMSDRMQEFDALMEWIIERVKEDNKTYYDNFLLLGDLNLNFDNPERDIQNITQYLKDFDAKSGDQFSVNFPFLDPHPSQNDVWRTNARKSETFDQIGFFFNDSRMPDYRQNDVAGTVENGFDYKIFDFVELFAVATQGKTVAQMSKEELKAFFPKFEHKVSDHMPAWVQLPLP